MNNYFRLSEANERTTVMFHNVMAISRFRFQPLGKFDFMKLKVCLMFNNMPIDATAWLETMQVAAITVLLHTRKSYFPLKPTAPILKI